MNKLKKINNKNNLIIKRTLNRARIMKMSQNRIILFKIINNNNKVQIKIKKMKNKNNNNSKNNNNKT